MGGGEKEEGLYVIFNNDVERTQYTWAVDVRRKAKGHYSQ